MSLNKTTFVIIRHGQGEHEVDNNATRPNLTVLGIQQAAYAGAFFHQQSLFFNRVITSRRARTIQTAQVILLHMGLSNIPMFQDERLRELNNGIHAYIQGTKRKKLRSILSETLSQLPDNQRWNYSPSLEGIDIKKYESEQHAARRFHEAMVEFATLYVGEVILVVSHARVMQSHLAKMKMQENRASICSESIFKGIEVENTGFYILEATLLENSILFKVVHSHLQGINTSLIEGES